jgi:hypothetical protein
VPLEEQIHLRRLDSVARVVAGCVATRRVQLSWVGRALAGSPKHSIKCVDRLLGNQHLAREVGLFHGLYARLLPRDESPILLVDWTDVGKLWTALVVSFAVEGRALVLTWEVHPRQASNSPVVAASVLSRVAALLPQGTRPIVVTDAGFKKPWMRAILARGWDFVTRVRGRIRLAPSGLKTSVLARTLWDQLSETPKDFGTSRLGRRHGLPMRLVGVWKNKRRRPKKRRPIGERKRKGIRRALEPWLLATSLPSLPASAVVGLYALRMRIEETFRDQKCPRLGFGLDAVKTTRRARIEVYFLLVSLAHFVSVLVGAAAEENLLHWRFQANTERSRRVLSWARLGAELLRRAYEVSLPELRDLPLGTAGYFVSTLPAF